MTSMAIVNSRGEIVQPAMIPTSPRCHDVMKSAVVKNSCRSSKYAFTRVVMDNGTWMKLNDSQRRLCGTEPKALAGSRKMT